MSTLWVFPPDKWLYTLNQMGRGQKTQHKCIWMHNVKTPQIKNLFYKYCLFHPIHMRVVVHNRLRNVNFTYVRIRLISDQMYYFICSYSAHACVLLILYLSVKTLSKE